MISVLYERFPFGTIKIFHARCIGLYMVLRDILSNIYELDIPLDLSIILVLVYVGEDLT